MVNGADSRPGRQSENPAYLFYTASAPELRPGRESGILSPGAKVA